MLTKHLFVVHGRATKPPRRAKQRLVRQALVARLERVDSARRIPHAGGGASSSLTTVSARFSRGALTVPATAYARTANPCNEPSR